MRTLHARTQTRPPAPRRAAGFTLVEMMVVVALVGVLTTLGAYGLGKRGHAQGAAGLARGIQYALLEARTGAVSDGLQRRLSCTSSVCIQLVATTPGMSAPSGWTEAGDRVMGGNQAEVWAVSDTADVGTTSPGAGPLAGTATVTFYPDGSATAATVYVTDLNARYHYKVVVYPATGFARMQDRW